METHNENISMSYDERRRELTRLVTTKKEDETTEWKIVLKENGIKKIWDTLIKDKKSAKEARARTEKEISTYDDQLSELEEVELTDEHKKIKETLKILQKDADRANIESKLEDSKRLGNF